MKNRLWRQRSGDRGSSGCRQDSQESTISTSSSIREFELFQQFCSNTSPDWEVPTEASEGLSDARTPDDATTASWSTIPSRSGGLSARSPVTQSPSAGRRRPGVAPSSSTSSMKVEKNQAEWRRRRQQWSQQGRDVASVREEPADHPPPPARLNRSVDFELGGRPPTEEPAAPTAAAATQPTPRPLLGRTSTLSCRVRLLDGDEITVEIERKSYGQALFDVVCQRLDLLERDYFACSFVDANNVKMWVRHDKKITAQVCDGAAFTFAFEVKFYPPDVTSLQEDVTRYQFCLQLQKDISSGRLPCSMVTYALLGSYLAQSLLGDYDPAEHGTSCDYLRHIQFAPSGSQTDELLTNIAELHRNRHGQPAAGAELDYLINTSRLAMYGVDLHPVLDYDGEPATVGICSSGLVVYKNNLRVRRISWVSVIQVSYKRSCFNINVRHAESGGGSPEGSTITKCRLATKQLAKRLWRSAVEHHMFFRLKESVAVDTGILARFLGSHFRFSGRTQQQVKHDAMVMARRNQLVAPRRRRPMPTRWTVPLPSSYNNHVEHNCADACVPESSRGWSFPVVDSVVQPSMEPSQLRPKEGIRRTAPAAELRHAKKSPTHRLNKQFSPVPSASSIGGASLLSRQPIQTTPSRSPSDTTTATVRTQSRHVTLTAPTVVEKSSNDAEDVVDFGTLISAHSHTSRTHTVETTTYQTEKDGVMVEKKLLINTEGSEDPAQALEDVMQSVAAIQSELLVDRVDICTTTELELD